ncbi:diaminopimelate epimerase [Pseudomonas lini]
MPLSFHKMHANGDDFVIVDSRNSANPMTSALAQRLGDRHRGIGFNQLAVVLDCDDAAARLMFWNADGSTLDACGSATRGAADRLMRESNVTSIALRTNRGLLTCERTSSGAISVNMGGNRFSAGRIFPWPWNWILLFYHWRVTQQRPAWAIRTAPIFVDDLTAVDIATLGPTIETNPLFPLKTNVHFVQIINRKHIRLRIWERGGGIPLGSGSCSCGAAVNGIRRGLLDHCVEVECDGGTVTVRWDGVGPVFLIGPVETTFFGNGSRQSLLQAMNRRPSHN